MKIRTRTSLYALTLLASTSLAGVAAAATLTVTGIEAKGEGGFELTVPTVEAVDANMGEGAIRALFSEGFAAQASALAGLDAAAIRIPEITLAYDVPGTDGETTRGSVTYRGIELLDVADGIAQSARVEGADITGGTDDVVIALGPLTTDLLDIGGIIGFYGLAADRPAEMRPIYENFAIEGGTLTSEAVNCTLGAAMAETFSARPLKTSFTDLLSVTSQLQAAEESETPASPEAIAAIIDFYADIFTAFESSPTSFEGFSCEGTDPDGKAFTLAAGPGRVDGFSPGLYPAISLDNFAIEAEDGWFRLGNFTWKTMDLEDAIENLSAAGGEIDEEWLAANWRGLLPGIEGFSLAGLTFDVPDTSTGGGGRVAAEVASLDLTLGDYVNGIPATIASTGAGINVPVPTGADGAALRAMGLDTLSMDYGIDARWNRDQRTITIDRLALAGDQLGGITISGTLANAGEELFSEREEVMLVAAMGLTATEITIEVENAGALSLMLAAAAAEEKQDPKTFQVAAAGMAQALPLALLGGTPEALGLSNALGAFLNGTPNLKLTLTAVDPAGISLPELMAAQENPALLKDKVSIAAEANGEPVPFVFPTGAEAPTEPAPTEAPRTGG